MTNRQRARREHVGGRIRAVVVLVASLGLIAGLHVLGVPGGEASAAGVVPTASDTVQATPNGLTGLASTDITCALRGRDADQQPAPWSAVPSLASASQSVIPTVTAGDFVFTDTQGLASSYHVSTTGVDLGCQWGILFWFEGDQDWDVAMETDQTSIADDERMSELAEVAAEANLVLVVPDSPDRSDPDTVTWWEDYADNGRWFRSLAHTLIDQWGASTDDLWFTGYSGGAEFIAAELMSNDPAWIHGGGAVMIGGGEIVHTPDLAPSTLTSMPMTWMVGSEDIGTTDEDDQSESDDEDLGGGDPDEQSQDSESWDGRTQDDQSDPEQSDPEQSDPDQSGETLSDTPGDPGADTDDDPDLGDPDGRDDGDGSDQSQEFGPEDHSDGVWSPVAVATQAQAVFAERGYTRTSLIVLPGLGHQDYDVSVLVASALGVTPPRE